ncbi:TPA: glycosyltransferase family 4 protein [Escherichia albertii]|nr:glycosyltransferase family 4 protein [Escherichia albertii]
MCKNLVFVVADITATGGIERVITHLASHFLSYGYNVEILSVHQSNKEIAYNLDPAVKVTFVDDNIKPIGRPGSIYKLWSHIISSFKLNVELFKRRKSIVVLNSFPVSLISFLCGVINKRCVVVEHVYYNYYGRLIKKIRKVLYKKFSKIIVLTERDKRTYEMEGVSVITIPNPLCSVSKRKPNTNILNKKIIAVGRLEYQKGFDILIKVFYDIPAAIRKDWVLDIYGDGSELENLQLLIKKYSLQNNIFLKGNAKNITQLYYLYDFFVFSSRFEGFGMVLLEAMNAGLPCISFDCPTGPSEILNNGEYGLLCPNGDMEALRTAMISLMRDEVKREELSTKSVTRSNDYSISVIGQQWNDLFIKLELNKHE